MNFNLYDFALISSKVWTGIFEQKRSKVLKGERARMAIELLTDGRTAECPTRII